MSLRALIFISLALLGSNVFALNVARIVGSQILLSGTDAELKQYKVGDKLTLYDGEKAVGSLVVMGNVGYYLDGRLVGGMANARFKVVVGEFPIDGTAVAAETSQTPSASPGLGALKGRKSIPTANSGNFRRLKWNKKRELWNVQLNALYLLTSRPVLLLERQIGSRLRLGLTGESFTAKPQDAGYRFDFMTAGVQLSYKIARDTLVDNGWVLSLGGGMVSESASDGVTKSKASGMYYAAGGGYEWMFGKTSLMLGYKGRMGTLKSENRLNATTTIKRKFLSGFNSEADCFVGWIF